LPGTDSLALKRVLCATDFSDAAAAALDVAVALARACKAEVRIVHVCAIPGHAGGGPPCTAHRPGIEEKSRAELIEALDRYGHSAIESGVTCGGVLSEGVPPEEIVRAAERGAADVIVMGPHSRGAADTWDLGSVTERVIREAPCPVLVARPFPPRRGDRPRHVTCGLDLRETTARTLECAVAVANALEADLLVLHVSAGEGAKGALDTLAAVVAKAGARSGHVQQQVVTGVPYQGILAAAHEHGSDLIVVGSHGGGVVERQFLGSTALRLLRHSPCSVLVVPARVSRARECLPAERLPWEPPEAGPGAAFRLRSWREP